MRVQRFLLRLQIGVLILLSCFIAFPLARVVIVELLKVIRTGEFGLNKIMRVVSANIQSYVFMTAVWALWQSNRQHAENARRMAISEAALLATQYKTYSAPMHFLFRLFELIGQTERYDKKEELNTSELMFTFEEMETIFGRNAYAEYEAIKEKITPEIIRKALALSKGYYKPPKRGISVDDVEPLCYDVLNSLNIFAILINTRAANRDAVYQSLHESFLGFVRISYPVIATLNSEERIVDLQYSDIRELYNKWQEVYLRSVKHSDGLNKRNARERYRMEKRILRQIERNIKKAQKLNKH